jgi:hypothetical protein
MKNQMQPVVMRETQHQVYSCGSLELRREGGKTPNGNPMNNRWVLRSNGEFIDFDIYRNDIVERHSLRLQRDI